MIDAVLKRAYDEHGTINSTVVAGTASVNPAGNYPSEAHIWRDVFDPATNTIRVIAV